MSSIPSSFALSSLNLSHKSAFLITCFRCGTGEGRQRSVERTEMLNEYCEVRGARRSQSSPSIRMSESERLMPSMMEEHSSIVLVKGV